MKEYIKEILIAISEIAQVRTCAIWNEQFNNETKENPIVFPAVFLTYNVDYVSQTPRQINGRSDVNIKIFTEHYQDLEVRNPNFETTLDECFEVPSEVVNKMLGLGLTLKNETLIGDQEGVNQIELNFQGEVVRDRIITLTKHAAELKPVAQIN